MPLQPFSFDLRVSPNDGREDKIELEIGDWILTAATAALDIVRESICGPPEVQRRHGGQHETHGYGWMFNRPNDPQGRRKPPQIRSHVAAHWCPIEGVSQPLLFAGTWRLNYAPGESQQARPRVTCLRLSLNPLRFVRHQPRARNCAPENWPAVRLSKLPRASRTEGEFSLDGEDNWLPDTALFGAFASNEHWNHHLDRYIRSIVEAFDGELHRSAIGRAVQIQCRPDFRLKTVETVWEFLHPAPTELVAALAPLLFAYCGREAEIHHFPPMEGRTENALSVQISLRAGVKLRVYAKTNRRVRFEIIHDEINVRELLQEPASERSNAPPRQHRPWSQILNCLSSLRQRAAEELNTVLSYLRQRHQIAPSAFSPMRLIISIATALHDVDMTQTVLSLLTRNGMIATRRAGSELLAAVRLLVSAGVLERDEERRCYDVTLPYQQPLARLRQADLRRLGNGGIQRRRGN